MAPVPGAGKLLKVPGAAGVTLVMTIPDDCGPAWLGVELGPGVMVKGGGAVAGCFSPTPAA